MEPLVSVIVPVCNKVKYLNTLFQCLIKQTFTDFECIFIDDGSTDGSGDLCDNLSINDKRFQVIHIRNSGVSHARNVGIQKACGEYITFIDSDANSICFISCYSRYKYNCTRFGTGKYFSWY